MSGGRLFHGGNRFQVTIYGAFHCLESSLRLPLMGHLFESMSEGQVATYGGFGVNFQ